MNEQAQPVLWQPQVSGKFSDAQTRFLIYPFRFKRGLYSCDVLRRDILLLSCFGYLDGVAGRRVVGVQNVVSFFWRCDCKQNGC